MSAAKPPSALSYVYDGRECLGFVLSRGPAGHEAFDRDPHSIGLFKSGHAAANAVTAAADNERGAG
jgi:hypothetical protein